MIKNFLKKHFQNSRISNPIMVLGMHRSGTSMLTGLLEKFGLYLGSNLIPPRYDNEKGFFEHAEIVELDEKIFESFNLNSQDVIPFPENWENEEKIIEIKEKIKKTIIRDFTNKKLWGIKDPRIPKLMKLWTKIFSELNLSPKFVIPFRHPAEVASSLKKRDKITYNRGITMWLQHNVEIEFYTRENPRVFIPYDSMFSDHKILSRIEANIAMSFDVTTSAEKKILEDFVDPTLRHHQKDDYSFHIPKSALSLYETLNQLSVNPKYETNLVDEIKKDLDTYLLPCSETVYRKQQ